MHSSDAAPAGRLDDVLSRDTMTILPGVVDAPTACIAQLLGFDHAMVPGSMVALSTGCYPDNGTLTARQLTDAVRRISAASEINLVVDIDSGYGTSQDAARLAADLGEASVAAVILEDSVIPAPPSGTPLMDLERAADSIQAASEALAPYGAAVIARTNARAEAGVDECVARLARYAKAGASALFLFRPESLEDLEQVEAALGRPQVAVLPKTSPDPDLHQRLAQCHVRLGLAPSLGYLAALTSYRSMLEQLRQVPSPLRDDERQAQAQLLEQLRGAPCPQRNEEPSG